MRRGRPVPGARGREEGAPGRGPQGLRLRPRRGLGGRPVRVLAAHVVRRARARHPGRPLLVLVAVEARLVRVLDQPQVVVPAAHHVVEARGIGEPPALHAREQHRVLEAEEAHAHNHLGLAQPVPDGPVAEALELGAHAAAGVERRRRLAADVLGARRELLGHGLAPELLGQGREDAVVERRLLRVGGEVQRRVPEVVLRHGLGPGPQQRAADLALGVHVDARALQGHVQGRDV
mmetsp:Transcript_60849/g.189071  ORF Transcript_60849/g.189071 Transcript_60849/m.189071 type:complete len:234 (-) Transcript_60849:284-985(-)